MRRSNSRGSRFNADDCKKKEEETDRAQDGCEEARSQGREEKGRPQDEAQGQEVASLVAAAVSPHASWSAGIFWALKDWQRQRPRFLHMGAAAYFFLKLLKPTRTIASSSSRPATIIVGVYTLPTIGAGAGRAIGSRRARTIDHFPRLKVWHERCAARGSPAGAYRRDPRLSDRQRPRCLEDSLRSARAYKFPNAR